MKMSQQAINVGQRTVLRLEGGDRQRYLNGQVSNDVRKLEGKRIAIPACVTTIKGKLDALVHITEKVDCYLIDSEPGLRESLFARLDKYIVADDCKLTDVSDEWHLIHLLGETETECRSERFGQPGSDLWLLPEPEMPEGLDVLSPEAAESLRIRNGVPKWGAELTPDTLPAEAGLDLAAIDFHKGCYIGQEVISRIQSVGRVNRKLVCLQALGGDLAVDLAPGQILFDGEAEVGSLTSTSGRDALGYVRRNHHSPGTRLSLADQEKKNLSTTLEIVESRQA